MIYRAVTILFIGLVIGPVQPALSKNEGKCECSLYLKDNQGLPRHHVMSLTNEVSLNCDNQREAERTCQKYCTDELSTLNTLYEMDQSILDGYPPSQNLPCNSQPMRTSSFFTYCGEVSLQLTTLEKGPPICCMTAKRSINWCGSTEYPEHSPVDNVIEARELNLEVDPNDQSQNEILETPVEDDKKSNKTKTLNPTKTSGTTFLQRVVKYFGYSSIGEALKGVDIFSLPGKLQEAIKTYRDEMAMGRCYMEFTTFKLFTKQENPFEGLLQREKRDLSDTNDDESFDYLNIDILYETFSRFLEEAGRMFDDSEGRQYAAALKTFLPVVTQALAGGQGSNDPNSPSSLTTLLRLAGPLMLQMANKGPTSVHDKLINNNFNNIQQTFTKTTPLPVTSAANSSPLTSLLMNVAANAFSNMFAAPAQNRVPANSQTMSGPSTSTAQVNQGTSPGNSPIGALLKLFMNSMANNRPAPTQRPTTKPVTVPQKLSNKDKREQDEKRFIEMVLELIRPVFISILGSAPGESGVKSIRRVSTLSTLGRVDDNQRDEVNSPLFCFKRYMVNKAWTVTETGVRTFLSKFSPEEKSRMMKRML